MGIDNIGPGFNPHLLSDQSPVNAAISALVLPSAFRPVPDPETATGSRWELDPALLLSAEVTDQNPFTVTYRIRPEASWTDNAPIAADDFWYLWRQMVSQPGVVDPAGYDLITGVQSVDGGKTAVVTFSQPYPAWRELFGVQSMLLRRFEAAGDFGELSPREYDVLLVLAEAGEGLRLGVF